MSKGMHAVGQPEVVILLQCFPEEKRFPTDIFNHVIQIYWDAQTAGKLLNHPSYSLVSQGFLGNNEHAGFLYVRPSFPVCGGPAVTWASPPVRAPHAPWARAFPLRLMLHLGAEYRFYPCPLFGVHFREPLFGPIIIMRLSVDFRFYRYTLPRVPGLVVDLEARSTCIRIPKTHHPEVHGTTLKAKIHYNTCFTHTPSAVRLRCIFFLRTHANGFQRSYCTRLRSVTAFEERIMRVLSLSLLVFQLLKALNKSNERVLALVLIWVQRADAQYLTQASSIHSQPRRVTGSGFFVFSGALKSSSGYFAKSSIVEGYCFDLFCMEFLAGSNGQLLPAPYQDCLNQSLTSVVQSNSQYQELDRPPTVSCANSPRNLTSRTFEFSII
ncbi:zinc finger FYVE domain-containing protein 9 [Carassius gibelio]|uniref:zinc finger FYVE domain-containing protein 9 n=1 Tax=Carassius gibelio TaxID=101364 RepID=UPI0022797E6D|nr:zinc finger FYVE domain-containing protein 9 [Carassius gibelio]